MPQDSGFESPESNYSTDEINRVIESLEDEFRIPFQMHVQGFKYKEIADKLDLKNRYCKEQIFRYKKETDGAAVRLQVGDSLKK
ncbi:MAG: sigma factor-like helix-turn-helix DNA-binding protein [Bacteroidales bacterium]